MEYQATEQNKDTPHELALKKHLWTITKWNTHNVENHKYKSMLLFMEESPQNRDISICIMKQWKDIKK